MGAGDQFKCGWCLGRTFRHRQSFGGEFGMSIRLCKDCLPKVKAINVGGVIDEVAAEFSTSFRLMQIAA